MGTEQFFEKSGHAGSARDITLMAEETMSRGSYMAKQNSIALRHLNTLFNLGAVGGLTDRELLTLFTTRRDEAAELAFAVLVDRHGPMVLRVCQAVLRDSHDAQDAFQATFLVLVQKARGLWVRECLGPWLHQVAHRTASCARSARARRRRHERLAASSSADGAGESPDDLGEVLHEEVGRLPERYRAAVVLCLLEGLTPEQAARQLGWPAGTVHSRLARGRARLRRRLTRRGLAPEMAGTDSVLTAELAPVPPALVAATDVAATRFAAGETLAGIVSASVVSLTKEGLRTQMVTKLIDGGGSDGCCGCRRHCCGGARIPGDGAARAPPCRCPRTHEGPQGSEKARHRPGQNGEAIRGRDRESHAGRRGTITGHFPGRQDARRRLHRSLGPVARCAHGRETSRLGRYHSGLYSGIRFHPGWQDHLGRGRRQSVAALGRRLGDIDEGSSPRLAT